MPALLLVLLLLLLLFPALIRERKRGSEGGRAEGVRIRTCGVGEWGVGGVGACASEALPGRGGSLSTGATPERGFARVRASRGDVVRRQYFATT